MRPRIKRDARLRTLNYVATVGISGGEATVIVDSASELTWAAYP